MAEKPIIRFAHFLEQFPVLEFPLNLTEETVRTISRQTPPLASRVIEQFILPIEPGQPSELTEFVACARLPEADNFVGVIYWRADLAQYHYTLATFDPKSEELIDRLVIAGTSYDGSEVTQTNAVVTEALLIYQVSGQGTGEDYEYRASNSTARRFQIADSGKIIEL